MNNFFFYFLNAQRVIYSVFLKKTLLYIIAILSITNTRLFVCLFFHYLHQINLTIIQ